MLGGVLVEYPLSLSDRCKKSVRPGDNPNPLGRSDTVPLTPTIVDYGVGNLRSVQRAFQRIGVETEIGDSVNAVLAARALVLPGVGAFRNAIERLRQTGLDETVCRAAGQGTPLLGICLGMQLLAGTSEEAGIHAGLGLIEGEVVPLLEETGLPLPHMGWNEVRPRENAALFHDVPAQSDFYFVHAYHFVCANEEDVQATCTYGQEFSCAVRSDKVMGVQFHPEKSQKFGRAVLENFMRIAEET